MPVLFEPSDEIIWAVYFVMHLIDAEKSLFLLKAFEAFPKSWIKVYWVVITPSGYEYVGV